MRKLFTSESVTEGHPDKVADQISDAILDQFLAYDPKAHVACETFVTTGQVVIMGEVHSSEYIDLQTVARNTINRIGYTKAEYQFDGNSCGIMTAIHEQSSDINRGVSRSDEDEQGAGDQGMMFGYATNETENYMPVSLDLAHLIVRTLADIRKEGRQMTYLRPDAKSQVTVQYSDEGVPERIDTIVVSTQHDDFVAPADASEEAQLEADRQMLASIRRDVKEVLMPRVKAQISSPKVLALFGDDITYHVNPTGKFVIGGPHGDTGLTGRKIIVDTYGGKGAHGSLRRAPHRKEHGGGGRGRRDARAGELRHRPGRANEHIRQHLRAEPRGHERQRDCRQDINALRPAPEGHRALAQAPPAHVQRDGGLRPHGS